MPGNETVTGNAPTTNPTATDAGVFVFAHEYCHGARGQQHNKDYTMADIIVSVHPKTRVSSFSTGFHCSFDLGDISENQVNGFEVMKMASFCGLLHDENGTFSAVPTFYVFYLGFQEKSQPLASAFASRFARSRAIRSRFSEIMDAQI